MTPEERADAVAAKFVAFGQGRPTRVSLVMEISDAIRAAVAEEREALLKLCANQVEQETKRWRDNSTANDPKLAAFHEGAAMAYGALSFYIKERTSR